MTPTSQPAGSSYLKTPSPPLLSWPCNSDKSCTFSKLSAALPFANFTASAYCEPPIQQVLNQIKADRPGQGFGKLEETLREAGFVEIFKLFKSHHCGSVGQTTTNSYLPLHTF